MGKDVAKALNEIIAKINAATKDIINNKTEIGQEVQTTMGGVFDLAEVLSDICEAVEELAEVVSELVEA